METVTIILTTLNSERFVARSIESCLKQTYANIELLVVDGGSTDRTLEIVAGFDDERIRTIHQQDNAGKLPGALNLGMANARGEFITWTQDDSWYAPDAIEAMMGYLRSHPEVALVYSDYWDVDEAGNPIRYQAVNPPTREFMLIDDVVRQCFLFRRSVYEAIGPQDTRYFPVHEVPWRLKVAERFQMARVQRPLMYYTLHEASLTGQIGGWQLQRLMAAALRDEAYLDASRYNQRLAEIALGDAFDAFVIQGNFARFRRLWFEAVRRNPQHLRNLGALKMLVVSYLPSRDRRWRNIHEEWRLQVARSQEALIAQFDASAVEMSNAEG